MTDQERAELNRARASERQARAEVKRAKAEADAATAELRRREAEREREERARRGALEVYAQLVAAVENSGLPFAEALEWLSDEQRPFRFGKGPGGELVTLDREGKRYTVNGVPVTVPDAIAMLRRERPDLVARMPAGPTKTRSMLAVAMKGGPGSAPAARDAELRSKLSTPASMIRLAMRPGPELPAATKRRLLPGPAEDIREAFGRSDGREP